MIARYISDAIIERERVNEVCEWENFDSGTDFGRNRRERESKGTLVSLFCGGLSVETRLSKYFDKIICNDKQEYLIALYRAVQEGWIPPDSISEEEYKYIKNNKDEDKALTAFVGFGCSFGGKWFGGYGRHGTKGKHCAERSMCLESKSALLRDIDILKDATFLCEDYRDVVLPDGCVVYCDPPYKNTMSAYGLKTIFDSEEFWDWVRENSTEHHIYISELNAPDDFVPIWEKEKIRFINNNKTGNKDIFKVTEKLFVHESNI